MEVGKTSSGAIQLLPNGLPTTSFPGNSARSFYDLSTSTLFSDFVGNGSVTNQTSPTPGGSILRNKVDALVVVLVPLVFSLIFVVGIIGNAMVITVMVRVYRHQHHQGLSTTNRFLLNLAVADLLFIIFCVPSQATVYSMEGWPFGAFICILTEFFQKLSMVASVYTMVALSLDRYCAVVYATSSNQYRTVRNANICLVLIWFLALVLAILSSFTRMQFSFEGTTVCMLNFRTPQTYVATILIIFILGYVLPLLFIFACYTGLLVSIARKMRNSSLVQSKKNPNPRNRVTRIAILVVLFFAFDWFFHHFLTLWMEFGDFPYTTATFALKIAAHCLSYANSCVNPLIYAFASNRFRNDFKQVFKFVLGPETGSANSSSECAAVSGNGKILKARGKRPGKAWGRRATDQSGSGATRCETTTLFLSDDSPTIASAVVKCGKKAEASREIGKPNCGGSASGFGKNPSSFPIRSQGAEVELLNEDPDLSEETPGQLYVSLDQTASPNSVNIELSVIKNSSAESGGEASSLRFCSLESEEHCIL